MVCQRPSRIYASPINTFTLPLRYSTVYLSLSLPLLLSLSLSPFPPRETRWSFLDGQAKGFTRLSTRLTNRHWPAFPSRHFLPRIRPTWHGWSPTLFARLRGTVVLGEDDRGAESKRNERNESWRETGEERRGEGGRGERYSVLLAGATSLIRILCHRVADGEERV